MAAANTPSLETLLEQAPKTMFGKLKLLRFLWNQGARGQVGDNFLQRLEDFLAEFALTRNEQLATHTEAYTVAISEAEYAQEQGSTDRALFMWKKAISHVLESQQASIMVPALVKKANLTQVTEAALEMLAGKDAELQLQKQQSISLKRQDTLPLDYQTYQRPIFYIRVWDATQKADYSGVVNLYINSPDMLWRADEFVRNLPAGIKQQLGTQLVKAAENHGRYDWAMNLASAMDDKSKAKELAQKTVENSGYPYEQAIEIARRYGLLGNKALLKTATTKVNRILTELKKKAGQSSGNSDLARRAEDAYNEFRQLGETLVKPLGIAATNWYLDSGDFKDAQRMANLSQHPAAAWLDNLFSYVAANSAQQKA